jgi:NADPH:quinone reductase-like Zn-dependent oxidoreductase
VRGGKDVVLIHSAAGGVGLFAVGLCRLLRCRVICTVGRAAKVDTLL